MKRPILTRGNMCWSFAVLSALVLGWMLGNSYHSQQIPPASRVPAVYASSNSREGVAHAGNGPPVIKTDAPNHAVSKYDVLRGILQHQDLAEFLRFTPIDESLTLNRDALKIYGMESYYPALEAALAKAKDELHSYDRAHLEEIGSSGPEKTYLIPASPGPAMRNKFEAEIRAIFPHREVADFFLKRTQENLSTVTGDFGETTRVLRIRALSPGDEDKGYPDMKYTVGFSSLDTQLSVKNLREQISQRTPAEGTAWIPTTPNWLSSFKEPPPYLAHLMQ